MTAAELHNDDKHAPWQSRSECGMRTQNPGILQRGEGGGDVSRFCIAAHADVPKTSKWLDVEAPLPIRVRHGPRKCAQRCDARSAVALNCAPDQWRIAILVPHPRRIE